MLVSSEIPRLGISTYMKRVNLARLTVLCRRPALLWPQSQTSARSWCCDSFSANPGAVDGAVDCY